MLTNPKAPPADPQTIALQALSWVLHDGERAQRLLALTGLDPRQLRDGLEDPALLAALLQHIAAHEPDLLACADALACEPAELTNAANVLGHAR